MKPSPHTNTPMLRRSLLAASLFAVMPLSLAGQAGTPVVPAQVTTTGSAVVNLPPDRAIIEVSIETRANSASAAAADNARRQTTLLAELRRLGFTDRRARVVNYSVSADYDYHEGRKLIGYVANTEVVIALDTIARLGATLDAALAAGATSIDRVRYSSDSASAGRSRALAQAVEAARVDADALARAARGHLGPLVTLTTWPPPSDGFGGVGGGFALQPGLVASSGTLAVTPQDVAINVHVYATWQLVP